jgi:hypothetical protein
MTISACFPVLRRKSGRLDTIPLGREKNGRPFASLLVGPQSGIARPAILGKSPESIDPGPSPAPPPPIAPEFDELSPEALRVPMLEDIKVENAARRALYSYVVG